LKFSKWCKKKAGIKIRTWSRWKKKCWNSRRNKLRFYRELKR